MMEKLLAAGFTQGEAEAWEAVRVAARTCLRLTEDEPHHPMEKQEIATAIHVIQGWLAGRPMMRRLDRPPFMPEMDDEAGR